MASTSKQQVQTLLSAAFEACEDRKAEDIRILALDPTESGLTDYFLICSGNSDRQNVAITDAIEIKLKHEFGVYPNSVEGRRQGEWILMDYVDFIVHVFSTEKRAFYGLERLRKTATVLSIDELHTQLKSHIKAVTAARTRPAPAKKSAAKKTVAQQPAAKKAIAKKAAAKKPTAKKPTAKKSTAKKSTAKKPAPIKAAAKRTPAKKN